MTVQAFEYEPLPPAAPEPPALNAAEMVGRYRDLRDQKKAIADRAAAEAKPLQEEMLVLEGKLQYLLDQIGTENMRTSEGTVYKTSTTRYSVDDPHALREWIEANNRPDFYENRVSADTIKTHLEAGGDLPPGIKVNSFTTVNIRK